MFARAEGGTLRLGHDRAEHNKQQRLIIII